MPSIGETLREARMRQRLDIADVESRTKIRAKYLRALENEEFGMLPGPTFVKTFLRTYAEMLGLDPHVLVEEYRANYEGEDELELQPLGPTSVAAPGAAARAAARPRRRWRCSRSWPSSACCWRSGWRATTAGTTTTGRRARDHRGADARPRPGGEPPPPHAGERCGSYRSTLDLHLRGPRPRHGRGLRADDRRRADVPRQARAREPRQARRVELTMNGEARRGHARARSRSASRSRRAAAARASDRRAARARRAGLVS